MNTIDQIAAQLQGYDPQAMTADGVQRFSGTAGDAGAGRHGTARCSKRWAGCWRPTWFRPFDVPPHDNSAMDGYAFTARNSGPDAALQLQVVGTALAGKAWQGSVSPGQCVKIMTGAVMPAGLDTVVPQEFVTVEPER